MCAASVSVTQPEACFNCFHLEIASQGIAAKDIKPCTRETVVNDEWHICEVMRAGVKAGDFYKTWISKKNDVHKVYRTKKTAVAAGFPVGKIAGES